MLFNALSCRIIVLTLARYDALLSAHILREASTGFSSSLTFVVSDLRAAILVTLDSMVSIVILQELSYDLASIWQSRLCASIPVETFKQFK